MSFTHALPTGNYGPAKLIVASSAANGTHTSMASAMAAASVGDTIFLRDNITEDFTLTPGVNIAAWDGGIINTPTILGKMTMTGAGTSNISGIKLQTNGDYCISVTGSAASVIKFSNCYILADDNDAIEFSSSSSSALLYFHECTGDISTTGIKYFTCTGAGTVRTIGGYFRNNGLSATVNSFTAGQFFPFMTAFDTGFAMSGTSTMSAQFCSWNAGVANATAMNITSSNPCGGNFLTFNGGTSSAVLVGSGATIVLDNCNVASANTNALDGLGTILYNLIMYTGSSSTNNISTQTQRTSQPSLSGASGVMVQQVRNTSTAAFSTSVAIPADGTIPQITEGGEFITQAITPLNASNILRIEINLQFDLAVNPVGTAALFVDSTANALAAFPFSTSTAGYRKTFTAIYYTVAGSTSSRTYRVRVGLTTANNVTINPNVYGGVNMSSITVSEFTP